MAFKGNVVSRSGFKLEKKKFSGEPMVIVDEQDIINTYSEEEQFSCKKYFEYQKLVKENPKFGYKKCAKLLGVPQGRTRWWHTKGEKKAVPTPLKAIEKLKRAGLLPFSGDHKHAEIIFNILGTLFGDGGIDIRLNTLAFISADKRNIDSWEKDLLEIFPFVSNKINLVNGGEYGFSYNIRTFDRGVIRFFVALGAPVGNKVSTKYSLPRYIHSISRNGKISFLDGLLSSEVAIPQFRINPIGKNGAFFANFQFGLSKIDALENEHRAFLENLKKFSATVGLTSTPHIRKDTYKTIIRKDGHTSHCYRIFFQTHFDKVIKFNKTFSLHYSHDKKERLEKEVEKAVEYKSKYPSRSRWYMSYYDSQESKQ